MPTCDYSQAYQALFQFKSDIVEAASHPMKVSFHAFPSASDGTSHLRWLAVRRRLLKEPFMMQGRTFLRFWPLQIERTEWASLTVTLATCVAGDNIYAAYREHRTQNIPTLQLK
jgi:hypothetical protein